MQTIQRTLCCLLLSLGSLSLGCTADSPSEVEPSRDQARQLAEDGSSKADHYGDICAYWDWYDDGVCDEFCPEPDPDCSGSCRNDSDCFQTQCVNEPCLDAICFEGECTLDDTDDSCDPGMKECDTCDGAVCIPADNMCITTAEVCRPPSSCDIGLQECTACGETSCIPEGDMCITTSCPPALCDIGLQLCETCDGFVCAPDSVSCPLVQCERVVCEETCEYAGDGDCDDGGPDSDYSLCELGSDCSDCGAR